MTTMIPHVGGAPRTPAGHGLGSADVRGRGGAGEGQLYELGDHSYSCGIIVAPSRGVRVRHGGGLAFVLALGGLVLALVLHATHAFGYDDRAYCRDVMQVERALCHGEHIAALDLYYRTDADHRSATNDNPQTAPRLGGAS